jgi:transcriptional regulator with XRE-family HTH domain
MDAMLTQQQLGEAVMVGQSAVAYWEAGKQLPLKKYRPLLAKALHCSLETLEQALEETVAG